MSHSLSRQTLNTNYLSHRTSRDASRYEECIYKIWIPYNCLPKFMSATIATHGQGKVRKQTILNSEAEQACLNMREQDKGKDSISSHKDVARIGEFVFLLAAKLKRDILHGIKEDEAGFLHTEIIKRLKHHHLTSVPPTIYTSRNRVFHDSKDFLKSFLIEPSQIFHLLCCWGLTGKRSEQQLIWWPNIPAKNIIFQDGNQEIDGSVLKKRLDELFPEEVLRDEPEIKRQFSAYYIECVPAKHKVSETKTTENVEIIPIDLQIKEFRDKLKQNAIEHLSEKLHNKGIDDYRPLGIEIGLPKTEENNDAMDDGFYSRRYDHNRNWQDFDCEQLKKPDSVYILSSETGSGKTTFLRNLQLALIETTDKIPLFLQASDLEGIDFRNKNRNNFLKGISDIFTGYLEDGKELGFLQSYFDNIVFLVDGLDQIRGIGTGYKHLVDNLLGIIKTNLVITSRPFALIEVENYTDIKLLRLNEFTEKDIKVYFSEHHLRAKELCNNYSNMLSVPMLAYVTRTIIARGEDKEVNNRAQLYNKFISHIFKNHMSGTLKLSFDDMAEIRDMLGEISYKAIVCKTPYLQKIPYNFAKKCLQKRSNSIDVETLLKSGLPSTIINESGNNDLSLYFSHQSFQEYIAAEWAGHKEKRVDELIRHYKTELLSIDWYWCKIEGVFNFIVEAQESFLEDVYLRWCKDKSDFTLLIIILRCFMNTSQSVISKEQLFGDIIEALDLIDHTQVGVNNGEEILFHELFPAMLLLDRQKASNYIFKYALEFISTKHDEYVSMEHSVRPYFAYFHLSMADMTKVQIDHLLSNYLARGFGEGSFTGIVSIAKHNEFSDEHIFKIIEHEFQNANLLKEKMSLLLSDGVAEKIKTKHIDKLCSLLDSPLSIEIKFKILCVFKYFPLCYADKIQRRHWSKAIEASKDYWIDDSPFI